MKRTSLALLLIAVLVLTGCAAKQSAQMTPEPPGLPADVVTQAPVMTLPTQAALPEGYDPSSEESYEEPVEGFTPSPGSEATEQPSGRYAGATPIPLDPIDVTKAPKQALTFTYAPYTAAKLGLTFEAPAGYIVDDIAADSYVLSQPEDQILDNHRAEFTFQVTTVTSSYAKNNIRQDLRAKLADLGRVNYQSWAPSDSSERTLLNAPAYYANYRGVLTDGTIVRGRVHMALLPGNKLLTVHMTCPAEYNTDFTAAFAHLSNTLKTL